MPRRVLQGIVVSDKNHKTITVRTERFVKHPLYKKFVKLSKKYSAHDETNDAKLGDKVAIIECAPISKSKTWTLHRVLDRSIAAQAAAEAATMVAKIDADAAEAAAVRDVAAAEEAAAAAAQAEAAAPAGDEQPDAT